MRSHLIGVLSDILDRVEESHLPLGEVFPRELSDLSGQVESQGGRAGHMSAEVVLGHE